MSEELLNRFTKPLDNTKFNLELPPANPRILRDSSGRPYVLLTVNVHPGDAAPLGPITGQLRDPSNAAMRPAHGIITERKPANPAAGANLAVDIPANQEWLLHGISFRLATDANVATRVATASYSDVGVGAGSGDFQSLPGPNQAASLTRDYYFIAGWPTSETAFDANNTVRLQLPPPKILLPTQRISVIIAAIQVGDQISRVRLYYELWLQS